MIDLEQIVVPAFAASRGADGVFRYIGVNAANEARSGNTTASVAGRTPHDLFAPEIAERLCGHYRDCISQRKLVDYEVTAEFPAGRSWWRATLVPITGVSGEVDTILGTLYDFAGERRINRDLKAAHRHLDLAIRCLKGADWRFDVAAGRFEASDNLALLMGEDEPRPVAWDEWVARIEAEDLPQTSCNSLLSGETAEQVVRFRFRNARQEERWAQCRRIVSAEDGSAPVIYGVVMDVTDERQREMKLEEQAHRDSLTGLLNRRGFRRDLDRAMKRREDKRGLPLALFMLDLDGFKLINDRHGHGVGDDVLIEVARRLTSSVGERGVIARLGGDEFILACPGVDEAEAAQIAQRLGDVLSRPFQRDGVSIGMGGSVGQAWRRRVIDLNAMMAEADEHLYDRKRRRKAAAAGVAPGEADLAAMQMSLFAA